MLYFNFLKLGFNQFPASLTALIKTIHNSLSSKIYRFYGAQVEMSGKIDKLTDISQQKCGIESEDEIEENNLILLPVQKKSSTFLMSDSRIIKNIVAKS